MIQTLEALRFRVTAPEPTVPEAIDGAVITALNEEAVSAAAFANKGSVNIVVTYEAFGMKMFGGLRQEIIWADHAAAVGRRNGWLSVPLVLTSDTWENGQNEQSHQDPSMAEVLLGETGNISRVLFPADWNTAVAAFHRVYQTQGQTGHWSCRRRPCCSCSRGRRPSRRWRMVRCVLIGRHSPATHGRGVLTLRQSSGSSGRLILARLLLRLKSPHAGNAREPLKDRGEYHRCSIVPRLLQFGPFAA